MDYPKEILPNPSYKIINCDLSNHYVIRFTNTKDKEQLWDSETNSIIIQHICSPEEKIDDLSMSLLGIYTPAHIFIDFTVEGKAKFNTECAPDVEPQVPVFEKEFIKNVDRHYWWIPVSKVHNIQFNYTRSNEPYSAKCTVRHTPMLWNYWHFSLRWSTDLGDLENIQGKQRKNVAKRIGHSARVTIAHFASIEIPLFEPLPDNCFTKN